MSLGGSLEDLSLLDILQIVNVSRRTGVLRLGLPGARTVFLYFHQGNVADIVGFYEEERFLRYFVEAGLVEPPELEEARRKAGPDPLRTLERLLDTGTLNPQLVEQARRLELAGRLKELTQEDRGDFAFFLTEAGDGLDPDAPSPFHPLARPVSPQVLLTQTLADGAFAAPPRPAPPPRTAVPEIVEAPPAPPPPPPKATAPPAPRPAPPPAPEPPSPPPERESRPVRVSPPRSRLTVVLCADESTFRHLLRKRLLNLFEDVLVASRLEEYAEAVERLLAKKRPFVALVDLLLPTRSGEGYLGGLEVLEETSRRFPQVKVFLMTDLSDEGILGVAKAHGVAAILEKPGLARLKVHEFEHSLDDFSKRFCAEVERLIPPVEEEVITFLHDLGAESPAQGDRIRDQLSLLKGLMGELASPKESSEISLLVLRLAAEYFDRAILFLARRDAYIGLGGFGETGDPELMIQKVRRLKVPVGAGAFFEEAVPSRSTVQKPVEALSPVDRDFIAAIGALEPTEVAAIPMVSRGRVIALLYGDNARTLEALPDLTGMEIFMAQAGLAMEKALLEMQLMNLKRSIPRELGD